MHRLIGRYRLIGDADSSYNGADNGADFG